MTTSQQKPSLREDQIVDLAWMMANTRTALLHDPGTGKTPPVCVYLYWLWTDHRCRSVWVMPKSLLRKNFKELLLFTDFKPEDLVIIDGTPKQRASQMRQNAKVFLMGFRRWSTDWQKIRDLHPDIDCVAVDEIHLGYGGDTSQQTQGLYASMRGIKRFVAMTGTLINGRLDTAYPTIRIIEPRYYANHSDFMGQHAVYDFFGNVSGWKNHDKLAKIFGKHCIRRTFESVYGKQEEVLHFEEVDMSALQEEKYREFEDAALLELSDFGWLDGSLPGVNMIRCRQILSHPECITLPVLVGKTQDGKDVFEKKVFDLVNGEPTGKDERMLIHLEDHKARSEPLVIFAALVPEIERIAQVCKKAGLRVGMIHGGVDSKLRSKIDEQFQAGLLDVVVASPATAGIGYNWEHVNHIIFASMDYMASSYLQAKRRAIRGKRKHPLRITVLEYKDTIERRVFEVIQTKALDAHLVDQTQERIDIVPKTKKHKELAERATSIARSPGQKLGMSDYLR